MIVAYTTLALAQFVFVFLKAFQQRNVAFDHDRWVIPISMLMAGAEVYVVARVASIGLDIAQIGSAVALGVGGGLGALMAMKTHRRLHRG